MLYNNHMGRGGDENNLSTGYIGTLSPRTKFNIDDFLPRRRETGKWFDRNFISFDVETTGVDVEEDRIVTASVSLVSPDGSYKTKDWLINPGIDIPGESSSVHGITSEIARRDGAEPKESIEEIINLIRESNKRGIPVVIYNARFDMSILEKEARRHEVKPLSEYSETTNVIDPFILDKAMDAYRPGSRKLSEVCAHYGIDFPEETAHSADVDALNTALLARKIAEKYESSIESSMAKIYSKQISWAEEQAVGLSKYLSKKHNKDIQINPKWPLALGTPK